MNGMVEPSSPGKSAKWIRALAGGVLSGLVVGIALFLLSFEGSGYSGLRLFLNLILALPGIFLHTWLFGDPFARLLSPAEAEPISWRIRWLTLGYWTLFGFGLTYLVKNNRMALGGWFLMLLILAAVVFLFA